MNDIKSIEKKTVCLVIPSLSTGGMERVMVEIGNYLAKDRFLKIHLVILSNREDFFSVSEKIIVHKPCFPNKKLSKLYLSVFLLRYLRRTLKKINPYSLLSFGSMYNSFVMIAAMGLGIKTYLSDRSHPFRNTYLTFKTNEIERHDGLIHFLLRRWLYPKSTGIIVQTSVAENIVKKTLKHPNVIKIPNPARQIIGSSNKREKIILNVGRFIKLKQQDLLIKVFSEINEPGWKLMFAGDGPTLMEAKKLANNLNLNEKVIFAGTIKNIDDYYHKCEIFAFTSKSEGFPNALAEALNTPMASIAFNCIAGPSDLIDDKVNGFLVTLNNVSVFKQKLELLMKDDMLREKFRENAKEKMKEFDSELVLRDFYKTLTQ